MVLRIVDVHLDGTVEKAQIMEVQWDHLGKDVLHVDFKRVSADERIEITVPIELKGIAPGIAAGGVLDQPLHTLHVECPAIAVPDSIRVNIGELQLEMAIHVKDLKLPEGVKVLDDATPSSSTSRSTWPKAEERPKQEPTATAEPEVITRKKGEGEGGEEK